jgi:hypothetical protein
MCDASISGETLLFEDFLRQDSCRRQTLLDIARRKRISMKEEYAGEDRGASILQRSAGVSGFDTV